MSDALRVHSHVFLGGGHARNEARTWAVIGLCGCMMAAEIVGGWLFASVALLADGLHMSTHAGALLLAACAYSYARRHASDCIEEMSGLADLQRAALLPPPAIGALSPARRGERQFMGG